MRPRRLPIAALFSLATAAAPGCHGTSVPCTPPPAVLSCPDAGGPSFAGDVFPNVFVPVCDNCHAPGQVEASIPLTSYQQIYGPASGPNQGSEAKEIFNQVFESCLMPPGDAPVPLDEERRQTLLDWFACGVQDSPAADAGAAP
ncbi:MAG TPA: hypothetical protein VMT03_02305 [Polyangia bacterium]|nr:hypothetical protein [Polyangia bacterium]